MLVRKMRPVRAAPRCRRNRVHAVRTVATRDVACQCHTPTRLQQSPARRTPVVKRDPR